ncbi:MAG: 30S ribosomal protein S17 [Nanoarchaeota archaeon]|nr:30S ribosomal protein S17 [Nanoarchaeota archaeon]
MKKTETKVEEKGKKILVGTLEDCHDKNCHIHGNLKTRGRTFEGTVTKKFPHRITIEFERMIYSRKYERYYKSKTKLHAKLTKCMEKYIDVGDLIKIQETRPLSKIIHFVVIDKIKSKEEVHRK